MYIFGFLSLSLKFFMFNFLILGFKVLKKVLGLGFSFKDIVYVNVKCLIFKSCLALRLISIKRF
jgi:hypothetical protein